MKALILLSVCIYLCSADSSSSSEVKSKTSPKSTNNLPIMQKPAPQQQVYYQQQVNQPQVLPVQYLPKQYFIPAQQQPTMFIIAQPAFLPQHLVYGQAASAAQQLLNYFHSNPQAKYQFLYGGYQPNQIGQQYATHPQQFTGPNNPQLTSSTVAALQVLPAPAPSYHQQLVPIPAHLAYNQPGPVPIQQGYGGHYQGHQGLQLSHLAALANNQAQHFGGPIRSVPPIITGLENFTPEQQAQIKAQLGAHLGTPLTGAQPGGQDQTRTHFTHYAAQPSQSLASDNSQEKPNTQSTSSNLNPQLIFRSQLNKS